MLIGAVTIVIPLLAVLALAWRPTLPIMTATGPALMTDRWTSIEESGRVRALVESEVGREWLHLARDERFVAPDVLVYWSSERIDPDGPFPTNAVLLGALGGPGVQTLNLPARDVSGVLTLYSLGHGAILGSTPLSGVRRLGSER